MALTNLIILFFFFINLSKEISSNDFYQIQPDTFLKGSKVNFIIYFNENAKIWDTSTSIKIGDNNIPLKNCHKGSNIEEGTDLELIFGIYCYDILLEGDNTEIIYGGIVQTENNLKISFVDEYTIIDISKYLSKDSYDQFIIDSNIAAGLKYRTVKLGNYIADCNASIYDYTICYVKIKEEGIYKLTIDGEEYKFNKGTENERIATITVYEYKITEFPTFSVDSIVTSEEITFSFKMLYNE